MLAAAACASDPKSKTPRELRLAFACTRYGALPFSGGVLEQPAGLLERMRTAEAVYTAFMAYRSAQPGEHAKWKSEHPEAWEIIKRVKALRASE